MIFNISAPLATPNLIITPGGSIQSSNQFSMPNFPTYYIQDPNGGGGNSSQYTQYSNLPTGLTPISFDPRNMHCQFHHAAKSQQAGQSNDINNNNNNNFPTLVTYNNLQPVKSNFFLFDIFSTYITL